MPTPPAPADHDEADWHGFDDEMAALEGIRGV
ncbi:hypothetical protein JOD46_002559 [Agromyces aurantiacus]|nr:hypothetical protein [Agromyces aurantiacus]